MQDNKELGVESWFYLSTVSETICLLVLLFIDVNGPISLRDPLLSLKLGTKLDDFSLSAI